MAQYEVLNLDLATVRELVPITQRGKFVAAVAVTALPVGEVAQLSFGDDKPAVDCLVNRTFQLCPPENYGVYITNPAGAGTIQLVISYQENNSPGLAISNL